MAPPRKTTSRRSSRSSRGRKAFRSSRSVLPSPRGIIANIFRTALQFCWDIAATNASMPHWSETINIKKLFGTHTRVTAAKRISAPHNTIDSYAQVFSQIKVHRVTAHYVPYEAPTAPGEYCFSLFDGGENAYISNFDAMVGTPGSVVRKSAHPSRLVWYPTEPDDRMWMSMDSEHIVCAVAVNAAESSYYLDYPIWDYKEQKLVYANTMANTVAGKVIVELDVSMRGRNRVVKLDEDLRARVNVCDCRKCRRSRVLSEAISEQRRRDALLEPGPSTSGDPPPESPISGASELADAMNLTSVKE